MTLEQSFVFMEVLGSPRTLKTDAFSYA